MDDNQKLDNELILNNCFRCNKCNSILFLELNYENNEPIINYKCTQKHFGKEFISKFLDINKQKIKNTKQNKCYKCKKEYNINNIYKCITCNQIFCNECQKILNFSKERHKFIELCNFDFTCPFHINKYLYYCYKCNQNLCIYCLDFHKNHQINKLSKIIHEKKFDKLRNNILLYEEKINQILRIKDEILIHLTDFININNKILQYFKDMLSIYDNYSKFTKNNYYFSINLQNIELNIQRNQMNCKEMITKIEEINYFISQFSYSTLKNKGILNAHYKPINHLDVLNDGRLISSFSDGLINIYNKDYHNIDIILKVHNENVLYFTQLLDNRLITCSTDSTMKIVKILNDNNYQVDQTLFGHNEQIEKVIQYNNNLLISISIDQNMKVWEKKENDLQYICTRTIQYEEKQTNANAIIINKNEFATLSCDVIKFWNLHFDNFKKITNIKPSIFSQSMEMINYDLLCIVCKDYVGFCFIKISTHQIMLRIKGPRVIFSLIKCKNNSFAVSMLDEKSKICITKYKFENDDFIKIFENKNAHIKLILTLTELNNGEIVTGSNDGIIKFWI